ncbi:MAG: VWA domain-containing protein [Spirochaetales bacterium]|nr:VWA domain-containing protein [Spirochaetales bacterium]
MARYPEVFWLFTILFPLVIMLIWRYFSGIKGLHTFGGEWRFNSLREIYLVKWFFSSFGFLVFIIASILALAGFPGQGIKEPFKPSGHDIIYVIDISRSMLAEDALPSRLEKAKAIIRSISDGLEAGESGTGNRYGLVVFRGAGSRILPLTEDRGGLYGVLEIITPDFMSSPGTDISSGLNAALESFVPGSESGRHVVLFSDGEDLDGDPGVVLNRFREERIDFNVIGLGGAEGAFIPLGNGEKVTDNSGRDIVTKLDERFLRLLAQQGGGSFLEGEDSRLLEHLFSKFQNFESAKSPGFIHIETEMFRIYLLIALAGLTIYQISGIIRRRENI